MSLYWLCVIVMAIVGIGACIHEWMVINQGEEQ